jgi:hypothetical protein
MSRTPFVLYNKDTGNFSLVVSDDDEIRHYELDLSQVVDLGRQCFSAIHMKNIHEQKDRDNA